MTTKTKTTSKKTTGKSLPIPIVWPDCLLQVIDETTWRWKTVGSCLWTPNAIKAEVAKLKAAGVNVKNIWVNLYGERKPMF